jgi:YHS domain-containing protein
MSFFKSIRIAALALGLAVAGLGASLALSTSAHAAAKPAVYLTAPRAVAVGGYDLTSYFAGTPVMGAAQFAATHAGVTYHFASAANRARFQANPTAFLPQYGGYCAWAAAQGYTAPGRPRFWRVVDGKLYLNYDAGVQRKWERDIPGFIRSANANWPGVLTR